MVTFLVRDSHTAVDTVEYSTDAEHWQVLYPVDGIADSRSERFELSVTPADAARLVVRAVDAMNNSATASTPR